MFRELRYAWSAVKIASIWRSSSASNARWSTAATHCSICSTRLAPTSALAITPWRSTQASASCARVWPRCPGDRVQRAHLRQTRSR